jgi:hypothetical protein
VEGIAQFNFMTYVISVLFDALNFSLYQFGKKGHFCVFRVFSSKVAFLELFVFS